VRKVAIGCLVLGVSGCAVTVPGGTTDPAKFPAESVQKAATVSLVDIKPDGSQYLGPVQATSCQRYQWEPEPTNEIALMMMKVAAANKGANTVTSVTYTRSNINLAQNCYNNITAKGLAFRTN
jgi:uncharacterized protein YbjQ (UPF0145 family)